MSQELTYWVGVTLDFTKILVWPLIVLSFVFMFRKQIRRILSGMRKMTAAGVSFETDGLLEIESELRAEVGKEVGDTNSLVAKSEAEEPVHALENAQSPENAPVELGSSIGRSLQSHFQSIVSGDEYRRSIDDLVQAAAKWGHARALIGADTTGARIEWEGPSPRLMAPEPDRDRAVRASVVHRRLLDLTDEDDAERVHNLERRVKDLQREHSRLQGDNGTALYAREDELVAIERDLRIAISNLRSVYPQSGLV